MRGLPTEQYRPDDDDTDDHNDVEGNGPSGMKRHGTGDFHRIIRRSGSVGVILVFILVATWLAATDTGGQVRKGLREVLAQGGMTVQEVTIGRLGKGGESEAHGHGHGQGYGQTEDQSGSETGFVGDDEHDHDHEEIAVGKNGKPGECGWRIEIGD